MIQAKEFIGQNVPGLLLRTIDTNDITALIAVQKGRQQHDKIDPISTFEEIPTLDQVTWWVNHKIDSGSLDTVRVAEIDGVVAGYTWLEWWTEVDGVRLFLSQAALLPEWRNRGIGSAMLHWAETRLRMEAASQTETGPAFFGANATETEADDTRLLLDAGYVRTFSVLEMERDHLDDAVQTPLPDGLTLCPLQEEDFLYVGRSVTECYNESAFGVSPSADEEQRKIEWLKGFDPSICFVVWDGDEVAGQIICRIDKGRGEAAEVSVRAPWRRRGLAKALLTIAFCAFRERGLTVARLHTVAENRYGSVKLYQSAGFRIIKDHLRYRKPMDLGDSPASNG